MLIPGLCKDKSQYPRYSPAPQGPWLQMTGALHVYIQITCTSSHHEENICKVSKRSIKNCKRSCAHKTPMVNVETDEQTDKRMVTCTPKSPLLKQVQQKGFAKHLKYPLDKILHASKLVFINLLCRLIRICPFGIFIYVLSKLVPLYQEDLCAMNDELSPIIPSHVQGLEMITVPPPPSTPIVKPLKFRQLKTLL